MIFQLTKVAGVILVCGFVLARVAGAEEPVPRQQQTQPPRRPQLPPELLRPRGPALSKEQIQKQAEELRTKYPFESVADRLAYEDGWAAKTKEGLAPKLNAEAVKHLEALEVAGQRHPFYAGGMRTRALSMLHSEQVERFISREGFGLSRLPQPTVENLPLADAEAVRYPRHLLESSEDEGSYGLVPNLPTQSNPLLLPAREMLFGFHLSGQTDFVSPASLGLVRDRDHVAGFKPHQFRQLPQLVTKWDRDKLRNGAPAPGAKPVEEWVVRKLELVSLLKHEQPAVYVSATLPKMDELADAETRELSSFEAESLKSLRSGESLVARAKANHLEMFGALRAAKQCQQCHQVQRGELLGAFSYELHRSPELKPAKGAAGGG